MVQEADQIGDSLNMAKVWGLVSFIHSTVSTICDFVNGVIEILVIDIQLSRQIVLGMNRKSNMMSINFRFWRGCVFYEELIRGDAGRYFAEWRDAELVRGLGCLRVGRGDGLQFCERARWTKNSL